MILAEIKEENKKKRLYLTYEVLAKIALKYGYPGSIQKYNIDYIYEFWYDNSPPPSLNYIAKQGITIEHIKWFLHNVIKTNDETDFLLGLAQNTKIIYKSNKFPSLSWQNNNNNITKIAQSNFLGGQYIKKEDHEVWKSIPALCIKHSNQNFSYLAGLFAGGQIFAYEKNVFVTYEKTRNQIINLGIPIEKNIDNKILISPFWPALLSFKMPEIIKNNWYNIKKAYNANLYATILWKTYVGTNFIKNGIPYLQSARNIYYKYKCNEGVIKYLEKQRLQTNLVNINIIFRDVVQYLANTVKKKREII